MKIRSIRSVHGPNVFHSKPVLIMLVDLESLAEIASNEQEGFNDRIVKAFPGLVEHFCSPGHRGGFIERLKRGTFPAHIIEHVALELSEMCGIGVDFGKTVYGGSPGVYQVAVRFRSEEGMKYLLESAVKIVESLYLDRSFDLEDFLATAKRIIRRHELGPSTQAIVEAAQKRNIPWMKLEGLDLIQLGWGKYRKLVQATTTSNTTDLGVQIAREKEFTKKLLHASSIPVPMGELVYSYEEALRAMDDIGGGVVVKPCDGNHGRGVSLNIRTDEDLKVAFDLAMKESEGGVLIEECFRGKDYRVIVVNGKVVAAAERIAAHVTGDGQSTLRQLIDQENANPLRGEGHEKPLTKLKPDERKNFDFNKIIPKDEIVYLCDTANISTGGLAVDVTDEIHTEVRNMCERVARIVGLDVCGLDLILGDIAKPMSVQKGGVIEVNAGPGIRMHHYPSKGTPRDVGGAIVDSLFREKTDGRIPIISITGTNGKTTVTRLLDHVFQVQNYCTGMTTTDGIYIKGDQIAHGDTTGPISARTILSDPQVEIGILETARGGIVRRGLGFDWCDVGIITNIHADHIGQDGIETIDDILHIKQLVAERVRVGGTIILNADVPELVHLAKNKLDCETRKLVYFSLNEFNPVVTEHMKSGGTAYLLKGDDLYKNDELIASSLEIPLTLGGTASFHIANVLTTIAAAEAMSVPRRSIIRSLMNFVHHDKNKGRTNLFKVGRGHVLLDYGHNPDALIAIGAMTKKWRVTKRTGVITVPGDRSDDMVMMSGIAAAHAFDKVIVREDLDKRGREGGEIATLLCETVSREKSSIECEQILDPTEALKASIQHMEEKELVIYFYESFDHVVHLLQELGGVQTDFSEVLYDHSMEVSYDFSESTYQ